MDREHSLLTSERGSVSPPLDIFKRIFQALPSVCLILDEQFLVVSINRCGSEHLGLSDRDLRGSRLTEVYSKGNHAFIEQKLTEFAQRRQIESMQWECTWKRHDGSQYWARDTLRSLPKTNGDREYFLLLSEDITETHYLTCELQKRASTDLLTGLNNREQFIRHIDEAILSVRTQQDSHSLCYLDLDQFKVVNDVCGHHAGNEMLRQIATLLQSINRPQDLIGRLGGDEFGLLLVNSTAELAREVAQSITEAFTNYQFRWNDQIFDIGVNVGMVTINSDCGLQTADDCVEKAETACSAAKARGRYTVEVFNTEDDHIAAHDRIRRYASTINWALENDRFELHYQKIQPFFDHDGPNHLEILVRLINEDDQLEYPGTFIPAAENYGLSTKIDLWVTTHTINWFRQHPPSRETVCNINLSANTLSSSEFISAASQLIEQNPIQCLILCFEITETATIRNIDQATEFMRHFKGLGCQFALDDFGSGFSSFAHLKSLPIDYLKIDGQFIRNLDSRPTDLSLVMAIKQVADAFKLSTVAEFVETEGISVLLKALGIDFGQGYHIHKPEPLKFND
jgi:Amt family ammonium transporter